MDFIEQYPTRPSDFSQESDQGTQIIQLQSDDSLRLPHLRSISITDEEDFSYRPQQPLYAKAGFYSVVPVRYMVAILGFFCWMMFNCLRMTASLTIVAMVNWTSIVGPKATAAKPMCEFNRTRALVDGPFDWNVKMQQHMMAAYFYGLASSQVPGGWLAEKYSPKWVVLIGSFVAAITCVLSPPGSYYSYYVMVALMIARGIAQGMVVPAFSVLAGKWFPVQERSALIAICVSGMPLGGFLTLISSGYLCGSVGWEFVYYIWGVLGIIFSAAWYLLIYDSPIDHPSIAHRELFRILSLRTNQAARLAIKPKIPLKHLLRSLPVWSYFFVGFSTFWTISLYNIILPTFMGTILQFDLKMNGVMTSLPQLAQTIILLVSSFYCGYLQKNKILSANAIRKTSMALGLCGFVLCMIGTSMVGCHTEGAVLLLTFALGISGINFAAVILVPVDLCPRFAGTLSGMMSVFGALSGVIIPAIVVLLSGKKKPTMRHWYIVFYISSALCFFSVIFFLLFGKSEVQPWNYPELMMKKKEEEEARRPSLLPPSSVQPQQRAPDGARF